MMIISAFGLLPVLDAAARSSAYFILAEYLVICAEHACLILNMQQNKGVL